MGWTWTGYETLDVEVDMGVCLGVCFVEFDCMIPAGVTVYSSYRDDDNGSSSGFGGGTVIPSWYSRVLSKYAPTRMATVIASATMYIGTLEN